MKDSTNYFRIIFENAKHNSILLLDEHGIIREVNRAFSDSFGYLPEELCGQHLEVLFTPHDRLIGKAQKEVAVTLRVGICNDDNYLVHKSGRFIWVTGESIKIQNDTEVPVIVKLIHDINSQKQLERFLLESDNFLDSIFDSTKEVALIILDGNMKVIKANKYFTELFELKAPPAEGERLSEISHEFWRNSDLKTRIRELIVSNRAMMNNKFTLTDSARQQWDVSITSKLLAESAEKKVLLVIQEYKDE